MKKLLSLIAAFICIHVTLQAQTTISPYVESQYRSGYGTMTISWISIDDEGTYVMIEDITPRTSEEILISFSSNTTITFSNKSRRISSWGLWDGEEFHEKEFNHNYSLKSDRRYQFALLFPPIPSDTKEVSIRENVRGGFYWNGIHLKNDTYGNSNGAEDYYFRDGAERRFSPTGSGTCFAINEDGYVATCYHVVEGASRFRIRGIGNDFNKLYKARLVSTDKQKDLAILKIEDSSFKGFSDIPYRVSSKTADVGEEIFVLGYPLRTIMGNEIKLTDGLVSSLSGYQGDKITYQVTATVQSGNSGGPLFDKYGDVIGIVNARLFVESASYAIKGVHLKFLSVNNDIPLNSTNTISNLSLAEQIKKIRQFVFVIEVE